MVCGTCIDWKCRVYLLFLGYNTLLSTPDLNAVSMAIIPINLLQSWDIRFS